MNDLGGLILAAGLSSRMGAFKPLLPIGGQSMLRRVAALMADAGAAPIIVVTGHHHALVEAHLADLNLLFVHNPDYARSQMFDSLCLGLRALEGRCRRVLFSPADVPLSSSATVQCLLDEHAFFVRPLYEGRPGHPVLLDARLFPLIFSYRGEGGLGGLVRTLPPRQVCELELPDPGCVLDADRPEDYAALRRLWANTHESEAPQ